MLIEELVEKAFCEGYEYAQKEFALSAPGTINWDRVKSLSSAISKERMKSAKTLPSPATTTKSAAIAPPKLKIDQPRPKREIKEIARRRPPMTEMRYSE